MPANEATPGDLPYRRRRRSTLRLLFSTDYSQHVTPRLLKAGYRIVIAVDVFTVLMWIWTAYGLSQVHWIGWGIPAMIYVFAPFLGLVWLATVRITFEYLIVIFGISEKVHDLDRKVEYLATVTYHDHNPTEPATPKDTPEGMENAA